MKLLESLSRTIEGKVIAPGSTDFDQLARPLNARFEDVLPEAVVLCTSAEDVARTVSLLRRSGLESAIRSGGHGFAGHSTTRGVVIDVTPMNSVSASSSVFAVGAGARLGEVYLGMLPNGVTIPGGSCPSVGIAGLALGGGLGMLGRKHGLTSDHLVGARIVLADGRIVECDDSHHEDLFWALRGAGTGHFGVVTELLFRTLAVPPATTVFHLTWDFSQASRIVRAWLEWAGDAADEIAASLDLRASGTPEEPPSAEMFGTVLGSRSDAAALLHDMVSLAGADPVSSSITELPYGDMLRHWAERSGGQLEDSRALPAMRAYELVKSEFFARPFPAETIANLLSNLEVSRLAGQSREVSFSPWGGMYNRTRANATAFVHRDSLFWIKHTASVGSGTASFQRAAAHAWVQRSWEMVRPWGTGHVFPNFQDPDLADWGHAYYGLNYERLLHVKAKYDPGNLFRFRQSLPVVA